MNNPAIGMTMWGAVGSWIITTIIGGVPWIAFLMFTQYVGIRQYRIRDLETAKRIQSRLTRSSSGDERNRRMGWSAGCWYLLNIDILHYGSTESMEVWMISTNDSYTRLTEQEIIYTHSTNPDKEIEKKSSITVIQRVGTYYSTDFSQRSIAIGFKPSYSQSQVIEHIKEAFYKERSCVAFLHGPPGSGKSMVGLLLANSLGGKICSNLQPWQPGNTLVTLHNEAAPTKENPLIVMIDEVDIALMNIHCGNILPHKNIPIAIMDKPSWNRFLDEINRGMYPWTILLMTANRGPDFIRSLDPSYIRTGRVNLIEELTEIQIGC